LALLRLVASIERQNDSAWSNNLMYREGQMPAQLSIPELSIICGAGACLGSVIVIVAGAIIITVLKRR
jgi:hypothetical protein